MNAISNEPGGAATVWPATPTDVVTKSGPLFLSTIFHWGVFGVLCTQFMIYMNGFPNDRLRIKLLVYIVFTLEVVQTIMLTKSWFDIFGYGFGDPRSYDHIGSIWFSVPSLSGIVAFLTQMFYAVRLHKLSNSYRVPVVVFVLAVTQVAGAIFDAIILKNGGTFSRLPQKEARISGLIWAGGSALCDVVIAYFMTVYLWKRRSEAMEITQRVVNRIIKLVLMTGTLTALLAVSLLALAMLPNHISYYQVPAGILAKLYSNSMLALLNSRNTLSTSAEMESKPTAPGGQSPTVLRFVETFHDPGRVAVKPRDNDAGSVDEMSVNSGSTGDRLYL